MDVVVHIGTEKTGTTTLQALLFRNRERLRESGFYFVQSPGTHNNRDLPAYCLRQRRIDDHCRENLVDSVESKIAFEERIRRRFESEIDGLPSDVHTVLISSEHFHSRLLHVDEIENLRALLNLRFERITILVYLREQVSTAVSGFSTFLATGGAGRLPDFVRDYCTPDSDFYNYRELLRKWEQVFGRQQLVVRLFDPAVFVNGSLVDDFLAQLDPDLSSTLDTDVPSLNESVNPFGQSLLNAVNRHVPRFIDGVGYDPSNVALADLIVKSTTGPGVQLEPETAAALRAEFAESNEAVCERYFPEREVLFPEPAARRGQAAALSDADTVLLDRVVAILARGAIPPYYSGMLTELAAGMSRSNARAARQLLQLAKYLGPVDAEVDSRLSSWDQRSYGRREWFDAPRRARRRRSDRRAGV